MKLIADPSSRTYLSNKPYCGGPLQYYKPNAPDEWVGDCMPFFDGKLFHFYYLLDEGHHQALGGLGGHQWAHATSPDLVTWTHHPLALAITEDEEVSICTGSIFAHGGVYYAFHAVRRPDKTQRLGIATSDDSIHFVKHPVPPHAEPPHNYDPLHFRDPCVFQDEATKRFHMLVTAKDLDTPIAALGGCLAHLVSDDLQGWTLVEPFFYPGFTDVPECPDLFKWNDWYYLVFSNRLQARYRMARSPLGPWIRPSQELLDGPWTRVMKTAGFHNNRRIGVAWIGTRKGDSDAGRFQWGGHAVFREIVQEADGTLSTKFPSEMLPAVGSPLSLEVTAQTSSVSVGPAEIQLSGGEGMAALSFSGLPQDLLIRVRGRSVEGGTPHFGVRVRESAPFVDGVSLDVFVDAGRIELHDAAIDPVLGLDGPFTLEIVLKGDLIDTCVNGRNCLINRCPEQRGGGMTLYCHTGALVIEEVVVSPLVE